MLMLIVIFVSDADAYADCDADAQCALVVNNDWPALPLPSASDIFNINSPASIITVVNMIVIRMIIIITTGIIMINFISETRKC